MLRTIPRTKLLLVTNRKTNAFHRVRESDDGEFFSKVVSVASFAGIEPLDAFRMLDEGQTIESRVWSIRLK